MKNNLMADIDWSKLKEKIYNKDVLIIVVCIIAIWLIISNIMLTIDYNKLVELYNSCAESNPLKNIIAYGGL